MGDPVSALAHNLKCHDAGGDRGVERIDIPFRRYGATVVAMLLYQAAYAGALITDYEADGAGQILIVYDVAVHIGAYKPQTAVFQVFHRGDQICHFGNGSITDGAGRSFDYGGGQTCGAPFWQNYAVSARQIGGTDNGAEIVRVFNAVEKQKKRRNIKRK